LKLNAMRTLFLCLIALSAAASPISSAMAADCGIGDLAFLQGEWRSADGKSQGEERWSLTAANTWAGSSWVVTGGKLGFAEALSITVQDGVVEMHLRHFDGALNRAWEEKDAPMIFRLARCDASSAVFDGIGDKAGEHITYRRSGDDLDFTGDFLPKGKAVRLEVHMHKAS
jgi:hypothetical protein